VTIRVARWYTQGPSLHPPPQYICSYSRLLFVLLEAVARAAGRSTLLRSARIPAFAVVYVADILDLAHAGTSTADATTHVDAAAASVEDVHNEGGNEGGPADPQEEGGGLREAAVSLELG